MTAAGLVRLLVRRPRRYVLVLGSGLALSALVAQTPLYAGFARWMGDAVLALTAERLRFEDVLVVDINEQAMAALQPVLGAWPYDRAVYGEVLEFLRRGGARAVVFDVLLVEPREGDGAFARALHDPDGVWLAARGQQFALARAAPYFDRLDAHAWTVPPGAVAERWRDVLLPTPALDRGAGVGIISVVPDDDGVLRRIAPLHAAYGRVLPAMPLAALYAPGEHPPVRTRPGSLSVGAREWPVDGDGQVLLRVPRNRDFLRVVGFDQVLAAARGNVAAELAPGRVRGRTVFVGSSAVVLGDYARLPLHGRTAGLGILALAFADLAHGQVLLPASPWLDLLLVLVAAALPLLLTNRRRCAELVIASWALLGVGTALTLHLAVFGWLHRQSDVSFALTAGLFVALVQLGMRFRTLYEERRQLRLDKRAADEASALKSRFLAHMTHELRTPLTAIMGYNRLLAEAVVSDEERRARTAVVERNGTHLLALINNLLDQAKIEAGQMSVDPRPERVRALLEDCRATLEPLAAAKGVALQARCAEAVPEVVSVDALRLTQILLNLGGNAVKFTGHGSVTLTVDWHEDVLQVRVEDTGPGMGPAALERIFEAFQQADDTITRSHGGTGLGLTISRSLARLMGGDIRVESRPGHGTCFMVDVRAPLAASPTASPAAAPALQGRVLLADDTEDIRELVGLQLRRLGLTVTTAADGAEAVGLALQERPQVVLMDMEMPVMNGLAAARALREAGYEGAILAMTGHDDDEHHRAAVQAGCDAVLVKPVPRARLAEAIEQHLAARVR